MASADCGEENWQTAKESIRERNKFMFNNSLLSDVKFVPLLAQDARDGSRRKRTAIPAHKYVLHDGVYVEAYTKSPVVLCDGTGVTAEQHMWLFVLLLIQVIVVV